MATRAEQDHEAIVAALRSMLRSDATDVGRPGRLRIRLEAALGADEAHRLRRLVHQVVVASEDNLPVNLTRIAPLTAESLQRLSGELAESRGWSPEVASRTTHIWASALGFEELVASSWPREAAPRRPSPGSVPVPELLAPTAMPPGAQPPGGRTDARGPAPAPDGTPWPRPARKLAQITRSRDGEDAWGVTRGCAGMSLVLFTTSLVVLLVVLCAPVLLLGTGGLLLPLVGFAVASLLVRWLGLGVLVASQSGMEFTPYDGALRKERADKAFSVPWSEIGVREGLVSRLDLGGRSVQVGPRNRAFVRAAAPHAGRGR